MMLCSDYDEITKDRDSHRAHWQISFKDAVPRDMYNDALRERDDAIAAQARAEGIIETCCMAPMIDGQCSVAKFAIKALRIVADGIPGPRLFATEQLQALDVEKHTQVCSQCGREGDNHTLQCSIGWIPSE